MDKMLKRIILGAALLVGFTSLGQQESLYTQYMYNMQSVNPAYAGTRDAMTATFLTRHQWVGLSGAPTTHMLGIHTPLAGNFGGGLSAIQDKIGPISKTSFFADVAYHIQLTEKGTLSTGVKAGFNNFRSAVGDLAKSDEGDDIIDGDRTSILLPNFGVGLYYHQEKFYVGVSAPRVMVSKYTFNDSKNEDLLQDRHYFFIAGTVFNISPNVQFRPTTQMKLVSGAPASIDLTGEVTLYDKFTVGVMGRSLDGMGALLGYQATPQLRLGYAYDYPFTTINQVSSGSHELMVRYEFLYTNKRGIDSPRHF